MNRRVCFFLGRTSLQLIRALLFLTMPLIAAGAAAATYNVIDLATLSQETAVVVRGVNSSGVASGAGKLVGEQAATGRRGLLFRSGAAALQIPGLAESDDTVVFAVNDSGGFVGSSNTASALRAFAGIATGGLRQLGPMPGDNASVAYAVNNLGQAAGFSSGAAGQRAVIWDANGAPRALPVTPAMSGGRATGINLRGDVSGVVRMDARQRPVLWPGGLRATELMLLPGHVTGEANAVNARGDAVGYSASASGVRRATLWPSVGGVIDLGTLAGGNFSQAFDGNDAGVVVGSSTSRDGSRAFVWSRTGGMQDLNALIAPSPFLLTKAVGINNVGMIIATGHDVTPGAATQDHDEAHDLPVRVFLLVRTGGGQ